jgi:hypothetical protein
LIYAYACLQLLYRKYDRRTIWDQLEKRLEQPLRSKEATRKAVAAPSFVNNW